MCCNSDKPKRTAFYSGEIRLRSFEPPVPEVSREEYEKGVSTFWIFSDIDLRIILSVDS